MSDEMDEIWALYLDDGTQSLDQMEAALLALQEGGPETAGEHVSALFRAVHTFKGNSRVLGLAVVESRAHVAEDLIGLVRDEGVPLDDEILEILLYAGDILREMLEQTSASRADVDPAGSEDLMTQMRDKVARCKGETGSAAPAEAVAVAEEPAAAAAPEPETVVPAAPPIAGMSAALSQMDQLGGSWGEQEFDEDNDDDASEAPQTVDETPEPEPEPEPEPAPAPAPVVEAVAPAPSPEQDTRPVQMASKRLIDDPSYRDIFKGMSDGAITKFRGAMSSFGSDANGAIAIAKREADNLHHAAKQMGLQEWVLVLADFMQANLDDHSIVVEKIASLVLRLEELTLLDLTDGAAQLLPAAEGGETFFDRVKDPLAQLSNAGVSWALGDAPDATTLAEHVAAVREAAEARGLIRVADAVGRLNDAKSAKDFRNSELRLYEELAAVERVLEDEAAASSVSPTELLRHWCAEHAFDTLAALDAALDGMKKSVDLDAQYSNFARQMRLIFHACIHHKLDTAGQLSMSLIDLFGRVQTSGAAPDSILMHIARGFIDTIELVFDALEQGEIPDTQSLDILFEQASNAAFTQEGLMTATAIERRLNLPEEFHRVLSPESVKTASAAIEARHNFYIIRADINDKEDLAEKFLEWISADNVKSITNVTVFRNADTLFDFLVSTPMDQSEVIASMAEMDPSGKYLAVQQVLEDSNAEMVTSTVQAVEGDQPVNQGAGLTTEMLESISEVAASQAMVNHMLSDLSEISLEETIETAFKIAEQDPEQGRAMIRSVVSQFSAKLQEAVQVETQLVSQMAHLQEQTVAIRSRPLEMLIRPLEALVETISRKSRSEAKLTSSGGNMSIDVTLMEHLRKMLRIMLTHRLNMPERAPSNIHMSFHRDDERVLVTLEDDGKGIEDENLVTSLAAQIHATSSELRQIVLPGGKGMRYHISMPLSMVVLEGMVVGVGGIRYVIPVDTIQTIVQPSLEAIRSISAANGRRMLRMDDGKMVSVQFLNEKSSRDLAGDANGKRRVFVVLGVGEKSLAVPVDELLGQQLVLLRPLRGVLRHMRNLTGIALLAGGEVGMVLSTNALIVDTVDAA